MISSLKVSHKPGLVKMSNNHVNVKVPRSPRRSRVVREVYLVQRGKPRCAIGTLFRTSFWTSFCDI